MFVRYLIVLKIRFGAYWIDSRQGQFSENSGFLFQIAPLTESRKDRRINLPEKTIAMKKPLTKSQMYAQNIIAVKMVKQKRKNDTSLGRTRAIEISRTTYLKICWFCGSPYQSHKHNSFACSKRCSQNLIRQMNAGIQPPMKMEVLTKEKNVKEVIGMNGF